MDRDLLEYREQIQVLRDQSATFTYRRLVLWLIRWIIGFGLIGLVVALLPEMSWLWWVGIGFAALTPVMALASQGFVSWKIRQAETAMAKLKESMREFEQD